MKKNKNLGRGFGYVPVYSILYDQAPGRRGLYTGNLKKEKRGGDGAYARTGGVAGRQSGRCFSRKRRRQIIE